jgi:hypothetical protein
VTDAIRVLDQAVAVISDQSAIVAPLRLSATELGVVVRSNRHVVFMRHGSLSFHTGKSSNQSCLTSMSATNDPTDKNGSGASQQGFNGDLNFDKR